MESEEERGRLRAELNAKLQMQRDAIIEKEAEGVRRGLEEAARLEAEAKRGLKEAHTNQRAALAARHAKDLEATKADLNSLAAVELSGQNSSVPFLSERGPPNALTSNAAPLCI